MNKDPAEFIHFLSKQHYLDGSRNVSTEDRAYIAQRINNFKIEDIFSNTTLHAFADNIAFIAAQTKQLDIATQILVKTYEEDQNDDNWLFEEIKQSNNTITPETIKEGLTNTYSNN